jgi:hypothetical protein
MEKSGASAVIVTAGWSASSPCLIFKSTTDGRAAPADDALLGALRVDVALVAREPHGAGLAAAAPFARRFVIIPIRRVPRVGARSKCHVWATAARLRD